MGEGAGRLALAHRRIDPGSIEEALGDVRHLGCEAAVGLKHDRFRILPGDQRSGLIGQRRIAIPVGEFRLAEPLAFMA